MAGYIEAWDRFWFTPRLPHTLAVLRIITGVMLLYSHLVLATDLCSFLGDHAWVNNETARQLHDGAFGFSDLGRSYLWYISNPLLLWMHHALTLLVTASLAVGFMTRITAPGRLVAATDVSASADGHAVRSRPDRHLFCDVLDAVTVRQLLQRRCVAAKTAGRQAIAKQTASLVIARCDAQHCGQHCDTTFSAAPVHYLPVWRIGQSTRGDVVGWNGDVVLGRQLRIPVDRHDLDRQLSAIFHRDDACDAVLGNFLLRACLAAHDATDRDLR